MTEWRKVNRNSDDDLRRLAQLVEAYKSRQKPAPTNGPWEHYHWAEDFAADARAGGWTDDETQGNLAALHRLQAEERMTNEGFAPSDEEVAAARRNGAA